MDFRPGRYVALDIGTVTCRMLVADVDGRGALKELTREYRITNLGEGVDAAGELKPQAMTRVADAVGHYLDTVASLSTPGDPAPRIVAVATSAARDARNAADFEAMLAGMGVSLAVIPGAKEAALSFKGASSDFSGEELVVVDIGGGSTEVIAGRACATPAFARSFNIGCRRMTEKFLSADPPTDEELARAHAWVREEMGPYLAQLRAAGFEGRRVVMVAGTATTVVGIRERMDIYDSERVHRAVVSRADYDAVYERLRRIPLAEREQIVGLDPGRAPVIVAGLVILRTVLELLGADSYTTSETDILHGMILDAAAGF